MRCIAVGAVVLLCAIASSSADDSSLASAAARWQPTPNLRWQLQYSTAPVDLSVEADVYKLDLFDTDEATIAELKAKGKRVVCYLNAGAWENWRPDAQRFQRALIGRRYEGWPGERWLDIRRIDKLAPVMLARLDLCQLKGFDGVLLDNVDGYTNKTGFRLIAADQLRFNIWFATEAHKRGLAVGLKNDVEQARTLLPHFDWTLAESCFSQGWCSALRPFIEAGEAVVVVEYTSNKRRFNNWCKQAAAFEFVLIRKRRELDAFRRECAR